MINLISKIFSKRKEKPLLLNADTTQQRYMTAAHEAAHVVLAYLSDYHSLVRNVTLFDHDSGVTFVTLSKSKLTSKGQRDIVNPYTLMEIAFDAIQIYYAGLEAEKILCAKNNLIVQQSYSSDDLLKIETLIAAIDPPMYVRKDDLQALTAKKVKLQWQAIEDVAKILLQDENGVTNIVDIIDHLNYCYSHVLHH